MTEIRFKKAKCDICFQEHMSQVPKDINHMRNRIKYKNEQPKELCAEIQINNQVTWICQRHFNILQRKFNA